MADELTLATKIETGETLFDFIRRCGRIKLEHWNGYSCSRELYEKLVTPALVAHLLEGVAHLLIQADAARAQGPSTSGADEREEIARAAWVLAVSDDPDFFGQEGAEFWERSKQITAERPEANCASLVNRCYSFADAILARAQGPGEAVAWRPMTADMDHVGPAWCAVRVYTGGKFLRWDVHYVEIDDETGEIAADFEQGWALDDYEFWMPIAPPSPPAATPPREG